MTFEEKLIRYIASKLIQKKFFGKKHRMPSEKELGTLIDYIMQDIKEQYKQFSLVRRNSESGLLMPLIKPFVDKLHI